MAHTGRIRLQSRREALGTFAAATAGVLFYPTPSIDERCTNATWGELVGTLPLSRPDGVVQPFGVKGGGPGLDARQITDLSTLRPDRLITPNGLACIRTEAPRLARGLDEWMITISGEAGDQRGLTIPVSLAVRSRWARTCSSAPATTTPPISG